MLSGEEEETYLTVGAVVSMTIAWLAPSDPGVPGLGSVSVVRMSAMLLMTPESEALFT